jgi:hypothetical protein
MCEPLLSVGARNNVGNVLEIGFGRAIRTKLVGAVLNMLANSCKVLANEFEKNSR